MVLAGPWESGEREREWRWKGGERKVMFERDNSANERSPPGCGISCGTYQID